jgi:hypothetical protein
MVAASDVVGWLALALAAASLVWQWFTWRRQPEQRVREERAVRRDVAATAQMPKLRSAVINAQQFIDPIATHLGPRRLVSKQFARLRALEQAWDDARRVVDHGELIKRMEALRLADEIAWLEANPDPDEAELQVRLEDLAVRLASVRELFD